MRSRGALTLATFVAVAALVSPATGAAASWKGLVAERGTVGGSPKFYPLDASAATVGTSVPGRGYAAAITPDGETAWVVDLVSAAGNGTLTRVDLSTSPITAGTPVAVPNSTTTNVCGTSPNAFFEGTTSIALSPAGNAAYIASYADDAFWTVNVAGATPAFGSKISLTAGSKPSGIAIAPSGDTAYVTGQGNDTVMPISLTTGVPGAPIALPPGARPSAIAITPNGSEAYVALAGLGSVVPIALATGTVGEPITTSGNPGGVAISADGARAYVSGGGGEAPCMPGALPADRKVTPVATGTHLALPAITSSLTQALPVSPALTPDGKRLFAGSAVSSSGSLTTTIQVFDTVTGTATAKSTGPASVTVAVAPDQAPTASFTRTGTLAGAPVSFDGSASTSPVGSIASYAWDFGDGATATTAGPTTTHTYLTPGERTATLTVTNSAGTSTERVFTGQQLLRNGGPSARTTRPLTIVASGAAVARLQPNPVDLGNVVPGASAATRSATLSNAGDAALTVSSVALDGSAAGAFSVQTDGCTGQRLEPAATCTVALRFGPGAPDQSFTADLVVRTDAPDPEQRVRLTGTSTATASVGGVVRNALGSPIPLGHAVVSLCSTTSVGGETGPAGCVTATTAADGRYAFAGKPAGRYALRVSPPAPGLDTQSADLVLEPGQALARDFDLTSPERTPRSFRTDTGSGPSTDAVPTVSWDRPFKIGVPADIAPKAPPGSERLYLYLLDLAPGDASSGLGQGAMVSLIAFTVQYGDDGRPAAVSPMLEAISDSTTEAAAARATMGAVQRLQASGGAAGGSGGCGAEGFAITPSPGGGIQLTIDWIDGPVALRLDPVTIPPPPPTGNRGVDFVGGLLAQALDSAAGATAPVAAFNTAIKIANTGLYVRDGNYAGALRQATVNWGLPALKKRLPPRSGWHGRAQARIWKAATDLFKSESAGSIGSPRGAAPSCGRAGGQLYIDPSGNVVTKKGAVPLEGAKVVLQRSDAAAGPFTPVPDGDVIMSPANRKTPDRTDVAGHFGWDVIPGYYRVDASLKGCKRKTSSRIMEIPPPVTDLLLKLDCTPPKRSPVSATLRRLGPAKGVAVLTATVTAKRGKPIGVVAFRRGRKALGEAVVERTGVARLTVDLAGAGKVTASYGGSARHLPAKATLR